MDYAPAIHRHSDSHTPGRRPTSDDRGSTAMTTRRRFLETVSGGLTGGWLTRALPLGLGAGVLGWPRAARAVGSLVSTECMRLDTNDISGWTLLGTQPPNASGT